MDMPAPERSATTAPSRSPEPRARPGLWIVAIGAGIGAFFGVVAACGGVGALAVYAVRDAVNPFFTYGGHYTVAAPDTTISISGPASIALNQRGTLTITVANIGSNPQIIDSLESYTHAIRFVDAQPKPSSVSDRLLSYSLPLAPGASETFRVEVEAVDPGDHSMLNIDVNLASGDFAEGYLSLLVTPAP